MMNDGRVGVGIIFGVNKSDEIRSAEIFSWSD